MIDLLKKGILMGLGAITITKEKAEQLVDELIKKGELAKDERSKAIQELLKKAEEQEKLLSGKVNAEIRKTMEKLGIPTRKDIERLEKKIDRLQKQ